MTFPATWTRKNVTGKYLLRDGTPARGQVVFSSPQIVIADGSVILPTKITATLDAAGLCTASLPATNDPAISPVGWTWRVQELVAGGGRDIGLVVDYAGGDIDLAVVAPLDVIADTLPAYGMPDSITGITQAQADARYMQQPAGGNVDDVVTKTASGAAWQSPQIPWASTNW